MRNVCGLKDADHAEYSPGTKFPLIHAAPCPTGEGPALSGTMKITLHRQSSARHIYQRAETEERFDCAYELNPAYERIVEAGGLRIVGRGMYGDARIVELPGHRFYIATLFQPALSSTLRSPHPIMAAFMKAAFRESRA